MPDTLCLLSFLPAAVPIRPVVGFNEHNREAQRCLRSAESTDLQLIVETIGKEGVYQKRLKAVRCGHGLSLCSALPFALGRAMHTSTVKLLSAGRFDR